MSVMDGSVSGDKSACLGSVEFAVGECLALAFAVPIGGLCLCFPVFATTGGLETP